MQDKPKCRLCGGKATDRHHVFMGRNRQKSEDLNCVVWLCRDCHNLAHRSREVSLRLMKNEQARLENEMDREDFIRIFGRSYL